MAHEPSGHDEAWGNEERPNAARIYDYLLGGVTNLAVDRKAAEKLIQVLPDMPHIAHENRAFVRRAVRHLVAEGVDQFLDLGSGLPTVGNVHDIAQRLDLQARVVYVDNNLTAVKYAQQMLANVPGAGAALADLRDPGAVFGSAVVGDLLDLRQPVAILMCAVLHFVSDADDPVGILAAYHRSVVPGSHLVLSHGTGDGRGPDEVEAGLAVYSRTDTPATPRSRAQVARLFTGWRLVKPGLVWAPQWRPDGDSGHHVGRHDSRGEGPWPEQSGTWVGVARRGHYPALAAGTTGR